MQMGQHREISYDVFADPVREILLLGVAAHIVEREHGDREPVRTGRRSWDLLRLCALRRRLRRRRRGDADLERIHPHRLGDVLELGLAEIGDGEIEPRAHLAVGVLGQTARTRFGDAFQPRGDIDAVAHQIAVGLLDDIAEMNADAEYDAPLRRQAGVALDHAVLDFDRAAYGVDDAAKLDEESVAHSFHDPPAVDVDGRIDEIAP